MAAIEADQWTVLIVVEDHKNLEKHYRKPPNTKLSELMREWKGDFKLSERWMFKSAAKERTYQGDSTTLEMVGETVSQSKVVYLEAELIDEPTRQIFGYLNERCHYLTVKPYDKLYEVFRRLPGIQKCFEFNGLPLNPKHSIQEAGLRNKSVFHETLYSITVKLSTGLGRVFRLPPDSHVLNLMEKVSFHETSKFALSYQGRYLKPDESIRQLTHVVEVKTAEFVVKINGRCVSWRAKDEPIPVTEFISELSVKGDINTQKLEAMEFVCVGCQRRICHSKDYIQQLPLECCKERSLTLKAMALSDAEMNLEKNDMESHLKSLHEHMVQCRGKNSRLDNSRRVSRDMKERFAKEMLDYNLLTQCSERLLRRISGLEEKVKELEVQLEAFKVESKEEVKRLQTANTRGLEEIVTLKAENKKLNIELEEKLGVKLLVIYDPDNFTLVPSRPEVQHRGRCPWDTSMPYIKCQVPGIRAGYASFGELSSILQKMFTGHQIRKIRQWRGVVGGKEVAEVTSRDDEVVKWDQSPYCGVEGAQLSWEEAERPEEQSIRAEGRLIICGQRQRTVLLIER